MGCVGGHKEDTEERVLSTFHSPPCIWKCYVDDTCTALHPDLIEAFHDHLNSIELCVQFTVEKESDERLALLDDQLARSERGTVSTSATGMSLIPVFIH